MTVFCKICYLEFKNQEELYDHLFVGSLKTDTKHSYFNDSLIILSKDYKYLFTIKKTVDEVISITDVQKNITYQVLCFDKYSELYVIYYNCYVNYIENLIFL